MKLFEKIKIRLKNGKSTQFRICDIPVLQISEAKGKKKIILPFFNKHEINKNTPVFYLKVNSQADYLFLCLQHWIKVIDSIGADYYILCDNKKIERNILKKIIFPNSNIKFIKSNKSSYLKKIVKTIASPFWVNATYANLTTFLHAKQNGITSFWNIDADDTLFCISPEKNAILLNKVKEYAEKNNIDAFSFDMHMSRTKGKHWSFGITYTRTAINWFEIFNKNKDTSWRNNYLDFDTNFNLDWFFTHLRNSKIAKCETFYVENVRFIHQGDLINNPIYAWIGEYKNNKILFPILLHLYGSKKYGEIEIFKDVIKIDADIKVFDCYKYMQTEYNELDASTKPHDNMWGII